MKIPISASNEISEVMLIELQGTIEFRSDDLTIGSLIWNDQIPTLVVGHHRLTGKIVHLTKPIYVMDKTKDPHSFNIKSMISKKIVFKSRPEHLMSAHFTDLQCFTKR